MAYDITGFNTAGPTKGLRFTVYVSSDNTATVEGAGYFNSAAEELAAQGVIIHVDENANTTVVYGFQNDGSTVTLDTVNKEAID